jgi:hypothetical protein
MEYTQIIIAFCVGMYVGAQGIIYMFNWNVRHEAKKIKDNLTSKKPKMGKFKQKIHNAMEDARKEADREKRKKTAAVNKNLSERLDEMLEDSKK